MDDSVLLKAKLLDLLEQRYQKDPGFFVNKSTISIELGITDEEAFRYADYLVNNKWATISGRQTPSWRIMITKDGNNELERIRNVIVEAKKNFKIENKTKNSKKKKDYDYLNSIKKFEKFVDIIDQYLEEGVPNDDTPIMGLCEELKELIRKSFPDGKSRAQGFDIKLRHVDSEATDEFGKESGPNDDIFRYTNYQIIKFVSKEIHEFINELLELDSASTQSNSLMLVKEEPLEFDVSHEDHTGKIKVFISHKFVESDQKLASILVQNLDKENIYGHIAEGVREYDLGFDEKIKQSIESSDYLVAILTKNSLNSPSIHQEIGYAKGVKVPVRILVEQEEVKGVLTKGKDVEKFSRQEFEKYLDNIIKDVLKKGFRKKISDKEREELNENVYRPCYDQMMNVYASREFFTRPKNPWAEIPHSWKLRTESNIKEYFEDYSKQLGIWKIIFTDIENDFFRQDKQIANSLSIAFERAGLLEQNDAIRLDERSTMHIVQWLHKFRYILFDPDINNANQLHNQLVEFAKLTPDEHERWLNRFSQRTDLYRFMAVILPGIREEFDTRISFKELKLQHQKLKESIENLKVALEDKLR